MPLTLILAVALAAGCAKRQNIKPPADTARAHADDSARIHTDGKCVYGCNDSTDADRGAAEKTSAEPGGQKNGSAAADLNGNSKGTSPDYILGPEDVIEVTVWKNEMLSKTMAIRPDGKISLPLIGDVQASGLSTAHLREVIRNKFKEYKETPEVSIIVKEINSLNVFVIGEVARPGKLVLRSETSLLQAITMSGGFTQFASTNNIVLLRRVGGVETRRIIRYKDIVSGKKPEDDVILQRGDTVVIP